MHACLCDYITDLTQNSIEAGASIIKVTIREDAQWISVTIDDNGKGMSEKTIAKAMNPFYSEPGKHDHRRVGLGLPLLKQAVDALAGEMTLQSELGKGTHLNFRLDATNWDLPPLGDIPMTLLGLMTFPGKYDLILHHSTPKGDYQVAKSELIDAVGELEYSENFLLAREFLTSQEAEL